VRLGETRTRTADVRIIAATNRDLGSRVQSGDFREDLWYRLRVIEIDIPPLRERREDIPALAEVFRDFFAVRHSRPLVDFSAEAREFIRTYDWPGNARELRNAVERAVIMARPSAWRRWRRATSAT
jgi:DNA-binding NtrC family response regulator